MERTDIERAVTLAGLTLPEDTGYRIVGQDPILRSPHHLGNGAAVVRLLTGLAASELWRLRTGRSQEVVVDARHAAAALRSYLHAHPVGEPPPSLDAGARARGTRRITRIVAARDGRYVQLHGSFHDGPQVLEELGLDESAKDEEIDAAVASRDAFELEAAFIRRRVCGGAVRSKAEWAAHPQGQVLVPLPAVTITRIGDAPPEPLPDGDRPTSGIRVVDLTRVLAGPTCAKTLAEHGADVLHISAPHLEGGGPFELETGIGKRQAVLDLNLPEHTGAMRDLLREADVFSQGYRLGTLARRGLSPQQVAALRPGIVYVSENCYGHTGPWSERPGWEQLGQAATGMSYREGQSAPDGVPRLAPAAVNDYSTGYFAAYGTMLALARRAAVGGSWHVQVSLSQTCMWYQRLGDDNDVAAADPGDVEPLLAEMDTADFGRIRYLTPALHMSETPPRWDLPPARQGAHEAVWLPR
ncbi:MAG: CoA transferase [Acidimicrobiaceae bacterium]|nr:CoA transferase [Acidimicrobiaceae bacterium]